MNIDYTLIASTPTGEEVTFANDTWLDTTVETLVVLQQAHFIEARVTGDKSGVDVYIEDGKVEMLRPEWKPEQTLKFDFVSGPHLAQEMRTILLLG